ncbi:hypothetical protein O181_018778 [Austropuccinia psidii MF-1]|uniref:BED-type domain-containing protein n=1 Tax=Austropuccinia psidii MF-1 TaxID=1389203 RepID=A0A9Q3GT02_9BASI|nr:hypothetical protein [Austropuccinia psidii MF-1]
MSSGSGPILQPTTSSDSDNATRPSVSEAPPNPKQSWVWSYFSEVDEKYVECNVLDRGGRGCKKRLKCNQTGSTKSMSNHLHALHCMTNPKLQAINQPINPGLDKYIMRSHVKKGLSIETLKTALVYFIANCDLPLFITKSSSFVALLELCNPTILNTLVCRTALTSHLSNLFLFHQEHICQLCTKKSKKLSFTAYTWTSPNVTAYMAVTGHFIDDNLKLTSLLLGLSKIEGFVYFWICFVVI